MFSNSYISDSPQRIGDLGQQLRRQREFHGISRQGLADRLHLTIQKVGNIERGESELSVRLFCQIALALGRKPWELLEVILAPILFAPGASEGSPIDMTEVRRFRIANGLSVEALADLCGVHATSVSRWENGEGNPSGPAAVLLEELLSGRRSLNPLTVREERLLDQALQWGKFKSREEFLKASLILLIQHGDMAS